MPPLPVRCPFERWSNVSSRRAPVSAGKQLYNEYELRSQRACRCPPAKANSIAAPCGRGERPDAVGDRAFTPPAFLSQCRAGRARVGVAQGGAAGVTAEQCNHFSFWRLVLAHSDAMIHRLSGHSGHRSRDSGRGRGFTPAFGTETEKKCTGRPGRKGDPRETVHRSGVGYLVSLLLNAQSRLTARKLFA
jgi:hypothetical protein